MAHCVNPHNKENRRLGIMLIRKKMGRPIPQSSKTKRHQAHSRTQIASKVPRNVILHPGPPTYLPTRQVARARTRNSPRRRRGRHREEARRVLQLHPPLLLLLLLLRASKPAAVAAGHGGAVATAAPALTPALLDGLKVLAEVLDALDQLRVPVLDAAAVSIVATAAAFGREELDGL